MELNAKLTSLEDEVKLLKGEVKLILSEIRTAILGQTNPFATESNTPPLRADPSALESRPPIRVVKVPEEGEPETVDTASSEGDFDSDLAWGDEDEIALEPEEEPAAAPPGAQAPEPPPLQPIPTVPDAPKAPAEPPPARQAPQQPPALAQQPPTAAPPQAMPTPIRAAPASVASEAPAWSLVRIASLTVWAEEALSQLGPERLQILLDLCEFAGYLPGSAKEALKRVMSLGIEIEPSAKPPSVNDCLVILYQLDALMRGDEPAGVLRARATGG